MKKIIYFLMLLLIFKDVLYSKTQVECTDVIEIRKRSWYYQTLGEYYYNNKRMGENELRNIFQCLDNDEVNRISNSYYNWLGTSYAFGLFSAIGILISIGFSANDVHNKNTKISWSTTGGLLLLCAISGTLSIYYQEKAVDTYNKIIIENKSSEYMNSKNTDIFSISYTHKLDF